MILANATLIPDNLQDKARAALTAAFGSKPVTVEAPVTGGVSGALAFRISTDGRDHLLRMEGRRSPLRNPHQYVCMQEAAAAHLAPALQHVDDAAGVVIMDYVQQRPLNEFPGGATALAAALGTFAQRLQKTAPFPVLLDFRTGIERLLGAIGKQAVPGLLDEHAEAFARLRAACPWNASAHVSSHNDPNPRNILFDGQRLWLVDWETAYRNEPLVDIAILCDNFAASPALETVLLQAWLGQAPGVELKARLLLFRQLTRLYYACLLSMLGATAQGSLQDLAAPSVEQFHALLASGQLKPTGAETLLVLGKMQLAGFLAGMKSPQVADAMKRMGNA